MRTLLRHQAYDRTNTLTSAIVQGDQGTGSLPVARDGGEVLHPGAGVELHAQGAFIADDRLVLVVARRREEVHRGNVLLLLGGET